MNEEEIVVGLPPTRCDVELIDTNYGGSGVLVCSEIRINGSRVFAPAGTSITVTAGDKEAVVLDIQLMPTRLTIRPQE